MHNQLVTYNTSDAQDMNGKMVDQLVVNDNYILHLLHGLQCDVYTSVLRECAPHLQHWFVAPGTTATSCATSGANLLLRLQAKTLLTTAAAKVGRHSVGPCEPWLNSQALQATTVVALQQACVSEFALP
jgi:hypothetical protein